MVVLPSGGFNGRYTLRGSSVRTVACLVIENRSAETSIGPVKLGSRRRRVCLYLFNAIEVELCLSKRGRPSSSRASEAEGDANTASCS